MLNINAIGCKSLNFYITMVDFVPTFFQKGGKNTKHKLTKKQKHAQQDVERVFCYLNY